MTELSFENGVLEDALVLRRDVLRWGAVATIDDDYVAEASHIFAYDRMGGPIGCISHRQTPPPEQCLKSVTFDFEPDELLHAMRVWGLAVSPVWQSRGIGSELLQRVILHESSGPSSPVNKPDADSSGSFVWVNAKETSRPFYAKHGFIGQDSPLEDELTNEPSWFMFLR